VCRARARTRVSDAVLANWQSTSWSFRFITSRPIDNRPQDGILPHCGSCRLLAQSLRKTSRATVRFKRFRRGDPVFRYVTYICWNIPIAAKRVCHVRQFCPVLIAAQHRCRNSIRHQYRDDLVPVAAINAEIGIQGENFSGRVEFR
jgi:hypothetical protein